jgi:hypothetical protein
MQEDAKHSTSGAQDKENLSADFALGRQVYARHLFFPSASPVGTGIASRMGWFDAGARWPLLRRILQRSATVAWGSLPSMQWLEDFHSARGKKVGHAAAAQKGKVERSSERFTTLASTDVVAAGSAHETLHASSIGSRSTSDFVAPTTENRAAVQQYVVGGAKNPELPSHFSSEGSTANSPQPLNSENAFPNSQPSPDAATPIEKLEVARQAHDLQNPALVVQHRRADLASVHSEAVTKPSASIIRSIASKATRAATDGSTDRSQLVARSQTNPQQVDKSGSPAKAPITPAQGGLTQRTSVVASRLSPEILGRPEQAQDLHNSALAVQQHRADFASVHSEAVTKPPASIIHSIASKATREATESTDRPQLVARSQTNPQQGDESGSPAKALITPARGGFTQRTSVAGSQLSPETLGRPGVANPKDLSAREPIKSNRALTKSGNPTLKAGGNPRIEIAAGALDQHPTRNVPTIMGAPILRRSPQSRTNPSSPLSYSSSSNETVHSRSNQIARSSRNVEAASLQSANVAPVVHAERSEPPPASHGEISRHSISTIPNGSSKSSVLRDSPSRVAASVVHTAIETDPVLRIDKGLAAVRTEQISERNEPRAANVSTSKVEHEMASAFSAVSHQPDNISRFPVRAAREESVPGAKGEESVPGANDGEDTHSVTVSHTPVKTPLDITHAAPIHQRVETMQVEPAQRESQDGRQHSTSGMHALNSESSSRNQTSSSTQSRDLELSGAAKEHVATSSTINRQLGEFAGEVMKAAPVPLSASAQILHSSFGHPPKAAKKVESPDSASNALAATHAGNHSATHAAASRSASSIDLETLDRQGNSEPPAVGRTQATEPISKDPLPSPPRAVWLLADAAARATDSEGAPHGGSTLPVSTIPHVNLDSPVPSITHKAVPSEPQKSSVAIANVVHPHALAPVSPSLLQAVHSTGSGAKGNTVPSHTRLSSAAAASSVYRSAISPSVPQVHNWSTPVKFPQNAFRSSVITHRSTSASEPAFRSTEPGTSRFPVPAAAYNSVARAPANGAPASIPVLPTVSAQPSQSAATQGTFNKTQIAQLANRVYEILVRRLASERQRRGY